jgi:hypothetical protein
VNFAPGIIKDRGDLRYVDAGAGYADPVVEGGERGRGRAVSRSRSINDRSLSVLSTDTHFEGASFEQTAEKPATANAFREPPTKIPHVDYDFDVNKIPCTVVVEGATLRTWSRVEEFGDSRIVTLMPAETGGGHVDQHEERRAREG